MKNGGRRTITAAIGAVIVLGVFAVLAYVYRAVLIAWIRFITSTQDIGRWLDSGMTLFEECEGLSIVPLQAVTEDLVEGPYGVQDEIRALDVTPLSSAASSVPIRGGQGGAARGRSIDRANVTSSPRRDGWISPGGDSEDASSWRITLP